MSVHVIYYEGRTKKMSPVLTREDYLTLRDNPRQKRLVAGVREGNEKMKSKLMQMNYSCLPNDDGTLKGSTTMSTTVGMDIDHIAADQLTAVRDRILERRDELGLLMLELSARGEGYHLVFRRRPELTQQENLKWASDLLGVAYDDGAKDITRVFFTTTASPQDLLYLDDALFTQDSAQEPSKSDHAPLPARGEMPAKRAGGEAGAGHESSYNGLPYKSIIAKWWELYNEGREPVKSNRDSLTYELAVNLRHICGFDRALLDAVIPCYDGFPQAEKMKCIDSALEAKRTQMPKRLKDVLFELRRERINNGGDDEEDRLLDDAVQEDDRFYYKRLPRMPQGIRDSIEAVGPSLSMPVVTAICPVIGMLATGVRLDVHGTMNTLNLISYIAGDFASGKGSIDPVIEAWTAEVKRQDKIYQEQEDEWRVRKRAAKNKEEQPEEPKLPVRCLTLNNTVANLAERLANCDGLHAFSFTPEADTVAQKWKSAINDFSVMLRQSYDGTRYDREARSAEAVNVHIDHLLWNVTMCGTRDALYRVVNNYTDGFQSRLAVASTPDNTFAPLTDKPFVLTDLQTERIGQVAHLLMLMKGEVVLSKLEKKGREWVENVRLESIKSDDKVRARQRFRVCVTAQRMTCCLMLCKVCEQLINKHGFKGAARVLKQHPDAWKELLLKAQTKQMLTTYDVLADYLLDMALYFFRDRIERAFTSSDYVGSTDRQRMGKNDSIFSRLETDFDLDAAMQQTVLVKGTSVTRNQLYQMLKNWKKQGLVVQTKQGHYHKV